MNRTAVINERVATRMPLGASVAGLVRGGGAHVGLIGMAEVASYGTVVDGRFRATDGAIASWASKKYGPTVVSVNASGGTVFDGDLMDAADYQFVASWKKAYSAWASYWADVKDSTLVPIEAGNVYDQIAEHDATVRSYQQQLNARGGSILIDPTPPKKSDGSIANPLSSISDTVSSVIWMLGIGIAVYLGLMYVVPALVGAAATSRSAARGYREA